MKKQLLLIALLISSISLSAQNNWKTYSNGLIQLITTNEDYTWIVYADKAVKINNRSKVKEEFELPASLYDSRICVSYKDELWICTELQDAKIFHLKNGTWRTYKNPGTDYITSIGVNPIDGTAVFGDAMSDQLIIIKNNNMRVLNSPDYYEFSSNLCMPNSNSIFYYSYKSSMIIELDTNGVLRNKFSYNRIGTTGTFLNELFIDKNQNLYVHLHNDGIFKMNLGSTDTTIQKIIPNTTLTSLAMESFKVDYNNNIVLKSISYSYDTLYTVFNSNGVSTLTHKVIKGSYGVSYYFVGFDHNCNPISMYKNGDLWIKDYFDWNIFYKTINHYEGDLIRFSDKGLNNKLYFGNETKIYEYNNDSIIKLSFNNSYYPFDPKFKSVLVDSLGNLFISIVNNGKLEIAKRNPYSTIVFESIVPNSLLSADDLDGKEMLFNIDNKLYVLMKNRISVYNGSNSWTSIPLNPSDNITELYSFCKDGNGNIWVGTNKGVAKVVNNQIVIQTIINKKNNINALNYDINNNCLVFTNNTSNNSTVCLYYINNQNLITLNINYRPTKISIDNRGYAYFQIINDEIWRYDINKNAWDTSFNNNIQNTPFNTMYPSKIEVDNNNRVYIFASASGAFNTHSIYVYDENGFSSINTTKNNLPNFNLYPNPTSGLITIDSKENLNSYSVYNMLGEVLENGKIENGKIDISELPSGVYTVKVVGERGESFRKVIRN